MKETLPAESPKQPPMYDFTIKRPEKRILKRKSLPTYNKE